MTKLYQALSVYLVAKDKSRYPDPEVHWCSLHNYNRIESVSERLAGVELRILCCRTP